MSSTVIKLRLFVEGLLTGLRRGSAIAASGVKQDTRTAFNSLLQSRVQGRFRQLALSRRR
jgi:hypothetical protein